MNTSWTRRGTLGLFGAALLPQSARGRSATRRERGDVAEIDFSDPETRNRIYVQLRARTDGKPTFTPYRGTLFGKVEGQAAVPLFQVNGFAIQRATRLGAARWRLDNVEAGYYGDVDTGEPLDRWTNPLNGRECRVRHYRSYQHLDVLPEGIATVRSSPLPAAARSTATMGAPSILDDRLWMHEDLVAAAPNRPKTSFADPLEYVGPTLTATSLATFSAAVADVVDAGRPFVASLFSYQTMNSWRPFMRMGETPGLVSFRMFGTKAETLDGVPGRWRERVLADYPDFLTRTEAAA